MIAHYIVWRSFLKDMSEIEHIECCRANTTKILDNILKNATLKREFAYPYRRPNNSLFDIQTSNGTRYIFTYGGMVMRT